MRLFVACDLPGDALRAVTDWQRREITPRPQLRANHAPHLTLSFLGDTDVAVVPGIVEVLRSISWAASEVEAEDVVFLPEKGRRHVVAIALRDVGGELRSLQARVSMTLVEAGFMQPEKRPWLPHVTVARYRRPGQPFPLQNVTIPRFCVVRMALYSSFLESAGAVHTSLAVFPAS